VRLAGALATSKIRQLVGNMANPRKARHALDCLTDFEGKPLELGANSRSVRRAEDILKGDIFDEGRRANGRGLCLGADCAGTMSAGIAVAVRQRWPDSRCLSSALPDNKFQLGDVSLAPRRGRDLVIYASRVSKSGGAKPRYPRSSAEQRRLTRPPADDQAVLSALERDSSAWLRPIGDRERR